MIVNILTVFFSFIIGVVFGGMAAFLLARVWISRRIHIAERKAARVVVEAKNESKNILREAREEADKIKSASETEYRERRSELQRLENRLSQKGESLERKLESVEHRERNLAGKEKEVESIRAHLDEIKNRQLKQLELISGMSTAEAKQTLIEKMEAEMDEETSRRLREWEVKLKEESNRKAQEILSQAIQRCASEVVSETTVASVPLPSDEMKGRLIGREGRNIRALEQATGVDLIIDDTPEAVTLSSFDPVRREVARLALTKLVLDGRIHPARIEEVVAKTKEEVEATIYNAGEQAAYQVGVHGLRPELIRMLGRLKYRTSYGQNVLNHSIEVAYLAGMIASELGANVAIAKKAGLLHDIGKAVDREVEGTHAAIGADLVKQWDKSPEVVQGIAEHHGETDTTSIWGFIVSAADAISGARPGARRESLENYLKRLKALEEIAEGFKGVEKSYAIQAGREIRILVKPEEIDDLAAMRLARDIVKKIEEGLEYPGQIKVTVLRETRAVDYAK
ncbi:MAG: ribonuclease Y [Dehalococcoidales bacterium]|nr:ribonuclease Y [Dehalococcoidales bacterium]